jgi:hypothetical protein
MIALTCLHTQVDIQGLTNSSICNFSFLDGSKGISKGQSANGLPLTVEQGTEEEHCTIFTGLAALCL